MSREIYDPGFSRILLKITSSEKKYINWANDFLKHFKLPRLRTMKNHGSGMKTTILINVSKISKESIEKIDMDHQKLIKEMGTRKNHQSLKPKRSFLISLGEKLWISSEGGICNDSNKIRAIFEGIIFDKTISIG